jgi:catechol-2,3-dioxygenase
LKATTLLIVKDLEERKQFYVQVMGLSIFKESEERLDLEAEGHVTI